MNENNTVSLNSISTIPNVTQSMVQPKAETREINNIVELNNIVKKSNWEDMTLSISDRAIATAIDHINKIIDRLNIELLYSIHSSTNSVVIKMRDKDTNEIIKEIPPEKVLDAFVQRMIILGLYVDERR